GTAHGEEHRLHDGLPVPLWIAPSLGVRTHLLIQFLIHLFLRPSNSAPQYPLSSALPRFLPLPESLSPCRRRGAPGSGGSCRSSSAPAPPGRSPRPPACPPAAPAWRGS